MRKSFVTLQTADQGNAKDQVTPSTVPVEATKVTEQEQQDKEASEA